MGFAPHQGQSVRSLRWSLDPMRHATRCFALALVLGLQPWVTRGAEPTFERIFGPEVPTGPYKHPACMTKLNNGDLYLVYYGGAGEYAIETGVFGSRRKKGEKEWSAPRP